MREGRAEPATSVRGATHIQVVSRATRDQADPLAPAGRRFGNFVFGANDGARAFAANDRLCCRRGAGRALGGTGSWKTGGIERSALSQPTGIALYARPWPEMSGQASGILATTALPLVQIEQTFAARRKPTAYDRGFLLSLARNHVMDSGGFGRVWLSGGNALSDQQIDDDTTRTAARLLVVIRLADVMLRIEIMTKLGN